MLTHALTVPIIPINIICSTTAVSIRIPPIIITRIPTPRIMNLVNLSVLSHAALRLGEVSHCEGCAARAHLGRAPPCAHVLGQTAASGEGESHAGEEVKAWSAPRAVVEE